MKKLLCFVLTMGLLSGVVQSSVSASTPFEDVKNSLPEPSSNEIQTNQDPLDSQDPQDPSLFVLRVCGTAAPNFSDNNKIPSWALQAAKCLAEEGITTNNPYNPAGLVDRGQMAAFLWRLAGSPSSSPSCGYVDQNSIPSWARSGACWLKQQGITTNNPFSPSGVVSRSQMATFLFRFGANQEKWLVSNSSISAPRIINVQRGVKKLTVSFTAPTVLNNNFISGYEYSTDGGNTWRQADDQRSDITSFAIQTVSSSPNTHLQDDTRYSIRIRAKGAFAPKIGSASLQVAQSTAGVPLTPSSPTVKAGNALVSVTVSAPQDNGGPLKEYEIQIFDASGGQPQGLTGSDVITFSSTEREKAVSGLTNGLSYKFKVRARNDVGWSSQSDFSNISTPLSPVGVPKNVELVPSNNKIAVVWDPPDGQALLPPERYVVEASPGGHKCVTRIEAARSCLLEGLTNGTVYSVTVRGENIFGVGQQTPAKNATPTPPPSTGGMRLFFKTNLLESGGKTVELPVSTATSLNIDWGDGTQTTFNKSDPRPSKTYANHGLYQITLTGDLSEYRSSSIWDPNKSNSGLVAVTTFGGTQPKELSETFRNAKHLVLVPDTIPASVTRMFAIFNGATAFNQNISSWETGNVTRMSGAFSDATSFNQPLNSWDVSKVTTMQSMFANATSFNQPLDGWDTANVTDMSSMFYKATSFNQPLNSWNTSKVTSLMQMFYDATSFNQPLNNWNTSNVTIMLSVFYNAVAFNQPLSSWDTSKASTTAFMFYNVKSFNQPLNSWNTSNVTNMSYMFRDATSFNQPLNSWNTSNVTNMSYMFEDAQAFNGSLAGWNVSNVTNMLNMFYNASSFNQPLNNWNVSKVTDMGNMFTNASVFNQSLSNWNVSKVTNMKAMFSRASAFNQPLSSWQTINVTDMSSMFSNATSFNQNISSWCVVKITSEPKSFSSGSPLVASNKPIWGTCQAF